MSYQTTEIFGYLAAATLLSTLIPQLIKTIKKKKVDDISYVFVFLQVLTSIFFLIYGILLKENPLIIANSLLLVQTLLMLGLKIKYSIRRNSSSEDNSNNLNLHIENYKTKSSVL